MFILFGVSLNVWSSRLLRKKSTDIDFYEAPNRLVTNGPFRISRNPIYLGGVILSLGTAILLGSLITFVFPMALLMILDRHYIPFEEKRLEKTFGRKYLEYWTLASLCYCQVSYHILLLEIGKTTIYGPQVDDNVLSPDSRFIEKKTRRKTK
jgi:hypothetical protein